MNARTIGGGETVAGVMSQSAAAPENGQRVTRVLGFVAVWLGTVALAAATFVLSYSGIHHLALQAGVAPRLARGYPFIVDAMLVVVLAAVLSLRGAGVPSKLFAGTTLVVVLAAAATADALYAAGIKLPDHVAAVTVAVVPWVLVFLAFVLLLAMLRYARVRRHGATRSIEPAREVAVLSPPARAVSMPIAIAPIATAPEAIVAEAPAEIDEAVADEAFAEEAPAEETAAAASEAAADVNESDEPAGSDGSGPDESELDNSEPDDIELDETELDSSELDNAEPEDAELPALAIPLQPGPGAAADTANTADTETTNADPAAEATDAPEATDADLAIDSDPGDDDPSSDEAADDDPALPFFQRLWSVPTPPAGT